jgi:hypothetical protein
MRLQDKDAERADEEHNNRDQQSPDDEGQHFQASRRGLRRG